MVSKQRNCVRPLAALSYSKLCLSVAFKRKSSQRSMLNRSLRRATLKSIQSAYYQLADSLAKRNRGTGLLADSLWESVMTCKGLRAQSKYFMQELISLRAVYLKGSTFYNRKASKSPSRVHYC